MHGCKRGPREDAGAVVHELEHQQVREFLRALIPAKLLYIGQVAAATVGRPEP
jgi:hypothetical protein